MQPLSRFASRSSACLWLVAGLCAACQHGRDFGRDFAATEVQVQKLLGSGAYDCAPRELALTRAHLEFARVDYEQGDADGSGRHLREASLNARAAARLSPRERCAAHVPKGVSNPPAAGPDTDLDGVDDSHDQCPDAREDMDGFKDDDGCPDPDNDQDGIPDTIDACPNQPEDKPGTPEADGCPEPDQDRDGVPDSLDRCPTEAGALFDQGCPRLKYGSLDVTSRALRLTQPILFEGASPIIRSVSYSVLDTVVAVLREHATITLEVQAHTDSRGDDHRNWVLSQSQAEAVRTYLIEHGIDASRLTAKGYGETRPIESNQTSQGRDINRRVEFVRTDTAPSAIGVE